MELTKLYDLRCGITTEEQIENTYAKYYALAKTLKINYGRLKELVPEEIMNKIKS